MTKAEYHPQKPLFSAAIIPHKAQRYETVGDWAIDYSGAIRVSVSDMQNRDYEFLVAVHELVETYLCQKAGITEESVTAFDVAFEAARKEGDVSEPGDEPKAPYHQAHCFATAVERMMCAALGLSWKDYEQAVLALCP